MKKIILIVMTAFAVLSCMTTVNKVESVKKFIYKENSKFENRRSHSVLTVKKEVENNKEIYKGYITSPFIHWAEISGGIAFKDGNMELTVSGLNFIANWPNGWTGGNYEATGNVLFTKNENGFTAAVRDKIQIWDLKNGEMRYYDDYYLKEAGYARVKNRMERISAVNKMLKGSGKYPEIFGSLLFKSIYSEPYIKTLKEFIKDKNNIFDESLANAVKSGIISSDLNEAPGIFLMDYNLDAYSAKILDNSDFR